MFYHFPNVFLMTPEILRLIGQFVLHHLPRLHGSGWEVETSRGSPSWFLLNCCWFIFLVFPGPIKVWYENLPLPFITLFTFEKKEMELPSVWFIN